MKAVIFAGGTGTRLWPLSRKKSPKQFEKIIDGSSTLQLAYNKLMPALSPADIFISTNLSYVEIVKKQLPKIPARNIIAEPEKKDVGPAVALAAAYLKSTSADEPFIILWSDHLVKKEDHFLKIIKAAEKIIKKNGDKIILIGQKPRYANPNLGWIKLGPPAGRQDGIEFFSFLNFQYRPSESFLKKIMSDEKYCWNLGYFVTTPRFLFNLFKRYAPQIHDLSEKIVEKLESKNFSADLEKIYHEMPTISFDSAVLEQIDPASVYVINEDIGWTDIGAWEGLKEALADKKEANVILGKVILDKCTDNLIFNYDEGKTIVATDIENLSIVNTKDVLLVAKKSSVGKIKNIVEKLEKSQNSHLI